MPEPIVLSAGSTAGQTKLKPGCRVEVELISQGGETERLGFTIVADDQADFNAGFLGLNTPLAKTVLGKFAGQTLPYSVGDLKSVKIISVQASGQVQNENVAARRQATIDKAIKHSDSVTAMIFAGAVNSKWGDYDFDKLDQAQWETDEADKPDQTKS
jgi:hypothetical protein